MSEESAINIGCNDYFSELCALSTTGLLTAEDRQRLEAHVLACAPCAALLADYWSLASEGMAKVGALQPASKDRSNPEYQWARDQAKARLMSSLEAAVPFASLATGPALCQPEPSETPPTKSERVEWFGWLARPARIGKKPVAGQARTGIFGLSRAALFVRAAALLVLATLVGYGIGLKRGAERAAHVAASSKDAETMFRRQLADAQAQRVTLNEELSENSKAADALRARAAQAEKELTRLEALKTSLEAKAEELGAENQQQSTSLAALAAERESLRQKLHDTESQLQAVRQDLIASQDERVKALLRSGSLEAKIEGLSAQLSEQGKTIDQQGQFLASDRDIRELMAARQLYIADVFDVDSRGKMKKPFGRVFYTKGKSLIFYAFDLDQQPGFRDAHTFQAWGRPDSDNAKPVSLGIFYMDNETNRRWVLKSDDPSLLAQIDAVFVTVEPPGGSKKPSGKPFLYAYLRKAPLNHP